MNINDSSAIDRSLTSFNSLSRFIEKEVPVFVPSHLTEEQKAKLIKTGRVEDDQKFIDKAREAINKEGVFQELKGYATYNAHHIRNAKTPEEKYEAALKHINCGYAVDHLVNHGEDIGNHYYRCQGLKHLLYLAINKQV